MNVTKTATTAFWWNWPNTVSASATWRRASTFFAHVSSDDNGNLRLEQQGKAGASVTLRFAMDTLVILHTCPHPLSTATDYPRHPVRLTLDYQRAPLPAICLERPENQRGLRNNTLYYLAEQPQGV
ncbi:hypothetical protein OS21_08370 [Dickeya oryzae]